jgi:hypothetical protein
MLFLSMGSAALREIAFLSDDGAKRFVHSTVDVQNKLLLIEYLAGPVRTASIRSGNPRGLIYCD